MHDPHVMKRVRSLPSSEKIWEREIVLDPASKEGAEVARKLQVWRREGVVSMACHEKIHSMKRKKVPAKVLQENPYALGELYSYYAWVRRWSLSVHLEGPSVRLYGMKYGNKASSVRRLNGALGLFLFLNAPHEQRVAFLQEAERQAGRRLFLDTHPLLRSFAPSFMDLVEAVYEGREKEDALTAAALREVRALPTAEVLPSLQGEDPRLTVERLFGKRHRRKDMTKALLQAHPGYLEVARAFRGLVVTDHLVAFLQAHPRSEEVAARYPSRYYDPSDASMNVSFPVASVREVLRLLDPRALPVLLRAPMEGNDRLLLMDLPRFLAQARDAFVGARPRTWEELHDIPLEHRRRLTEARQRELQKEKESITIEFTQEAEALHEAQVGPFTLRCPTHGGTIYEWSDRLENCLSSYIHNAARQDLTIAGVFQEDTLVGALEVGHDGTLRQLLRKRNRIFAPAERLLLEEGLKARGVTVPEKYWGVEGTVFGEG